MSERLRDEPLWIDTTCISHTRLSRHQWWKAEVMDGDTSTGVVVYSHSRKSARSKAYGALAAEEQVEEQR